MCAHNRNSEPYQDKHFPVQVDRRKIYFDVFTPKVGGTTFNSFDIVL